MKIIRNVTCILICLLFSYAALAENWTEKDYNDWYAKKINGEREVRKYYDLKGKKDPYVRVDIETDLEVIEGGLDNTQGSLDSVQQALFFSYLTNKKAVVVIYDTDNRIGKYEHQIKKACQKVGIEFRSISRKKS